MDKLDFDNRLYHLYQLMPDSETDGQRLAGCSVDQMFDDMFDSQVIDRYEMAFDPPPFNTYKENT
jgi:hypothetical protein